MATEITFGMDSDGARWSGGASCGETTCGPSFLHLPHHGVYGVTFGDDREIVSSVDISAREERDACQRNTERLFKGDQDRKLEDSV